MFGFFADPALTTPITLLPIVSLFDGTAGASAAAVLYFGNPVAGYELSAETDDEILIAVVDVAAGTGLPATVVKLAMSEAGLATATPGAALAIGAALASGAGEQVAIWFAVDTGAAAVGDYTDLALTTNMLLEVAV